MVRGVIYLFQQMFSGQDARAVIECPVRFVEETELVYIFDAKRQAGVSASRDIAKSEEDILTYLLFPQVGGEFLKRKYA